jgi:putative Mg2+ transporter-C (MgtC) family protein
MEWLMSEVVGLPDLSHMARISMRLAVAAILGGLLGVEREMIGKAAGLRTHMLVSLGAALFVLVPAESGLGEGDLGRVIQGVAAGIGFIGAGSILKRTDKEEITGLTTAANIWLTAAVGVAVGTGRAWLAAICVFCAWVILYALPMAERRISGGPRPH